MDTLDGDHDGLVDVNPEGKGPGGSGVAFPVQDRFVLPVYEERGGPRRAGIDPDHGLERYAFAEKEVAHDHPEKVGSQPSPRRLAPVHRRFGLVSQASPNDTQETGSHEIEISQSPILHPSEFFRGRPHTHCGLVKNRRV